MSESRYPALCFGKLPNFGDFVRYNASGPETLVMDQWIRQGLYFARVQLDQDWNSAYQDSSEFYFIFPPDYSDSFLIGLLKSSNDQSGRKFPFIVSIKVEKKQHNESFYILTPVIFTEFFQNANQFLIHTSKGLGYHDIIKQTESLSLSRKLNFDLYQQNYENFLITKTQQDFWDIVFDHHNDTARFLLFKNLAEMLIPLRKRNLSDSTLGLRFPLGSNSKQINYIVCFWIHICFKLLGISKFMFNLFWQSVHNHNKNYLYVFFRNPSSTNFVQMFQSTLDNDQTCKLDEEGNDKIDSSSDKIPFAYKSLLEMDNITLNDFLQRL